MNLQYITDTKGHKNAVQLPIEDWEKIKHDLKELEALRGVADSMHPCVITVNRTT